MPSACMPARTHGQFGFEKLRCSPQRRTQGFLRGSQVRTTAVKQLTSISRQLESKRNSDGLREMQGNISILSDH